jgi:hypothetical protein
LYCGDQDKKEQRMSWKIAKITVDDLNVTKQLIDEKVPNSSASFVRRFELFLGANLEGNMDHTSLLEGFVGQLHNCDLKWSTIEVYLKQALSYLRRHHKELSGSQYSLGRLIKMVKLMAASEDTSQAPRVQLSTICAIIDQAPHSQKILMQFLAYTGARVADAVRLKASQIRLRPSSIIINGASQSHEEIDATAHSRIFQRD